MDVSQIPALPGAVEVGVIDPERVRVRCRHCGRVWLDTPEGHKAVAMHAGELTLEMVPEEVRAKFKGRFRKAKKQTDSFQEQVASMFHRVLLKPGVEPTET